ncbi:uncharacterized protein Bfra_005253 [Botrytis fragariae]|uniref:BTB domain-containing protein n=1 Tax=Botrytis fragariae TaxID=1964551 RepID=A0A8H6AUB0_9HELO|nr:uncharacterized protein Bfra_005253 [Botrytis fragariae]KAF5873787.1 hypothetical protein Bfra_005253 [Botrytis fragariae]
MFRFVVGKNTDNNPAEFFVHEKAISQCSDSLYVLLSKGDFRESQEGCARWDDVSKETFERFAQFAYTGDYSVPEPVLAFNRIKPTEEEGARKKDKKKRVEIEEEIAPEQKPDSIARKDEYFRNLSFPAPPHNNYEESCTPVMFFDRNLSYSKVFIDYTSLYILGDLYCIDLLKNLALSKLYLSFIEFCVCFNSIVRMQKMLSILQDMCILRSYVATKMTLLFGNKGFKDLLKKGGLFALHLFEFVVSGVNKWDLVDLS